jgi:TOBE domain
LANEVRAILKAAQATALFVTHDQMEAFAIGDAIGVMHEGELHQWDDAYTLYHRPATRFVADFIGHGVFTPATLREVNNQVVVQTALGELTDMAECPLPCAFAEGQCDVLLRADDIVHDDDAPVKAEIVRKAFRGSEFLYTLRLKTGETVLAHVPSHHDHKIGEWIGIRAQVDHVVTFNRACPPEKQEMCDMPCGLPCKEPCEARQPQAQTSTQVPIVMVAPTRQGRRSGRRRTSISARRSRAQARRSRPPASWHSPKVTTAWMPGVVRVRQIEPSSVSSPM